MNLYFSSPLGETIEIRLCKVAPKGRALSTSIQVILHEY